MASGNTPAPFGFTGELQSQGLVYLRARWYDPSGGTFTSRDPFAGFPQQPYSLHYYQYGYSNPVLWIDPSGKVVPVIVIGAAVVVVVGFVALTAITTEATKHNAGVYDPPNIGFTPWEQAIPNTIDNVSTNVPKGWDVVSDACTEAVDNVLTMAKGEYVPGGFDKQQRNTYREAVHRYKKIWGLSARDDVPKWILDQIAEAIKEGAKAIDAAEEADSPPEDDE